MSSKNKPPQLGNKYTLLDLIGVGGMAEVYRCKLSGQKGFEKIIVLKKLLPQVAQDTVLVESFIDEARLAALLQHENIVHIYDFGELDGSYFIAMEYLFGKDLYSITQKARESGKPLGIENCLLITSKICEGMEYAHGLKDLQQRPLNLIHRDLSPHNVFVTYDGKVKIIDFGIARAELFDNRTKMGVIKGKISYMSPEQLGEKQIDQRSDIFSIGILLYEMLSGQRMFTGDTASLIRKCMQAEYENLENVSPGLFPGVYPIVNKALQKDRDKRYQSCAEMLEDIEDCLFAMGQRPNTQALKEYVHQLFEQSFENENNKLSSTIERTGTVVMGHDEGTQVLDRDGNTTRHLSLPFYHKILSPLADPPRRIVLASFFFYVITVFYLFVGLSPLVVEPNIDGDVKSEFVVLQQVQTVKDVDLSSSLENQEVPLILKEQEKKISALQIEINLLLDRANTAFKYRRFTVPEGDSAFNYFKKVLEIAPENIEARDGLKRISDKYADYAERDLSDNKVNEAQVNIQKGLDVYPQSGRLSGLRTRAVQEKRRLIKQLEKNALDSLAKDKLTSPVNQCAYKYYKDIEAIDHNSTIVRGGIKKIADRYAELADAAYRNLRLANAREYVKKGLEIKPDHLQLLGIKQDLSRSGPGIFFKMLEKNVQDVIE
jgi:serine/threonine protein kinase